MSRRQHTILILQVRIPVPAGRTQADTVEWVKHRLTDGRDNIAEESIVEGVFTSEQTQVRITAKETTYL